MLKEEIKKILSENSERKIANYLSQHPELILWSFIGTGGHSKYVLHEFPFGSKYKSDFVIPLSYSGAWDVHFVELKSPDDDIFTKSGPPSKSLNSAISQISDWKTFIDTNKSVVQQDLSDWCRKHDLLNWHVHEFPISNYTSDYLHDQNTFIWFYYHIIIGRRENVDKDKRKKMNQYSSFGNISIGTFDRFVDIAENYDKHIANPKMSINLSKIKE